MAWSDTTSDTTVDAVAYDKRGRSRSKSLQESICPPEDIDVQLPDEEETEETAGRGIGALHHIRSRTRSRTDETVIRWAYNDPENPFNWSNPKKAMVVFTCGMLVLNSTMGTSLPSMIVPQLTKDWGVTSQEQKVLPISVFMIGYVIGPLIWGPLSEHVGRRMMLIVTFAIFTLFTMACALAPNWPSLLVFRLVCGVTGSAPVAVVAGILADVYGNPRERGRAYAVFQATTLFGPLFAPIVSGYCSDTLGWRWSFWIAVISAAAALWMVLFIPETYGPILLYRRAKKMRKQDPPLRVISPRDLETTDLNQLLTVVLTRPLRMLFSELIVSTTCAYLALCYAIFYMFFQAYPIIFQQLYSLPPGLTGLCYLPIGGGTLLSLPLFWCWDVVLARATARGSPWTKREEFRRLPLALLGGPSFVIALFWLGWSAKSSVPFVAPMLAGIPFGFGFMLIFVPLLNYLTDAYDIYAASAASVASMARSLLAVLLPLATSHMFQDLGISGACSLLGGLTAGMCLIPFIFIWKGPSIRERSKLCITLRERREELARRTEEERLRIESPGQNEKESV